MVDKLGSSLPPRFVSNTPESRALTDDPRFRDSSARNLQALVHTFDKYRENDGKGETKKWGAADQFSRENLETFYAYAEDQSVVGEEELAYIEKELIGARSQFFPKGGQDLVQFVATHRRANEMRGVSANDDPEKINKQVIGQIPVEALRPPQGTLVIENARKFAAALIEGEAQFARDGTYTRGTLQAIEKAESALQTTVDRSSGKLNVLDLKLTNRAWRARLENVDNFFKRAVGQSGVHDRLDMRRKDGSYEIRNWNREQVSYAKKYETPTTTAQVQDILKKNAASAQPQPVRALGGGHAFNMNSSTGGTKTDPTGININMDGVKEFNLAANGPGGAQAVIDRFHLSDPADAKKVVTVGAGIRLNSFTKQAADLGLSLPVAGSTDQQSIAGLIGSDLHGTGRDAGFLSQQLLSVKIVTGDGKVVTFTKDESVPRDTPGHWTTDEDPPQRYGRLPVAGAIGTLGVITEASVKLVDSYKMAKTQSFVPMASVLNGDRLKELNEKNEHFSLYLGAGPDVNDIKTARLNTWNRVSKDTPIPKNWEADARRNELLDLAGTARDTTFTRLVTTPMPAPGQKLGLAEKVTQNLMVNANNEKPMVTAGRDAFARRVFFNHDENETGVPLQRPDGTTDWNKAVDVTNRVLKLCADRGFETPIEIRFTPDTSEGMIGPGTKGVTMYVDVVPSFIGETKDISDIQMMFNDIETMLIRDYGAAPHLGKKTAVTNAEMGSSVYGGARTSGGPTVWEEFQAARQRYDPKNTFIPPGNKFLNEVFMPAAPATQP